MTEETRQPTSTLGAFMERRRADLRLSKRQAAKRATLSDTTWRAIERGDEVDYRDETLVGIAEALQAQPEEVFALVDRTWNGSPTTEPTRAELISRLEAVEARVTELAEWVGPMRDGQQGHGGSS